ncbi:helix-turn-helix domain-containing protein [Nocardia sp. NPDC055321]
MSDWRIYGWSLRRHRAVLAAGFGGNAVHRHPVLQITLVYRGNAAIGDGSGRWIDCRAAVVPSGAPHAMRANDSDTRVLSILLFPGHPLAREITARYRLGADPGDWVAAGRRIDAITRSANWHALQRLPGMTPARLLDELADAAVAALRDPDAADLPPHPQLHEALDHLTSMLPAAVRLPDLAAAVFLSPGRLGRLFGAQAGGTFPAIVRWLRLVHWGLAVRAGSSLTDGAHAAGFTDLPHASRVCREMTGVAPGVFLEAAGAFRQ